MNEKEIIKQSYIDMCSAMISKDKGALDRVLDESFVLIHMTGMRQGKSEFIGAVCDGTLNYYSAEHENMDVTINKDKAVIVGQTYVQAAVFGGRKNYWRLQQRCKLKKIGGEWLITESTASTY